MRTIAIRATTTVGVLGLVGWAGYKLASVVSTLWGAI